MGRMIDADEAKCHQMTFAVKGKEKKMQDREMDLLEWVTKHTLEEIEEKWGMKVETVAEKGKKMAEIIHRELFENGEVVGYEYGGRLVRCMDCKYSEPSVYPQAVNCTVLSKAIREWAEGYGCPENKDKTCPATDMIMTVFEDHYCGWGERREDA